MVVIARHVPGVALLGLAWRVAEPIPDARARGRLPLRRLRFGRTTWRRRAGTRGRGHFATLGHPELSVGEKAGRDSRTASVTHEFGNFPGNLLASHKSGWVSVPGDRTLPPTILVADDDAILLRAYARVLTTNGYRVETAADGQSALDAFQKRRFDVILSDIDMPGLSGIELLEAVRAHDLDVPIVLVTGTPEVDSTIRAIEHGALRYLVKPVETAALVKVAGDAVRLHRIAKAKRQA